MRHQVRSLLLILLFALVSSSVIAQTVPSESTTPLVASSTIARLSARRLIGGTILVLTAVALGMRATQAASTAKSKGIQCYSLPSCVSESSLRLWSPRLRWLTVAYGVVVLLCAIGLTWRVAVFHAPADLPMIGSIRPGWSAPPWLSLFTLACLSLLLCVPLYTPIGVAVYLLGAYFPPRYSPYWDLLQRISFLETLVLVTTLGASLRWLAEQRNGWPTLKDLWPRDRLVQGMVAFTVWSGVSLLVNTLSRGLWLPDPAHHPVRLLEALVLFLIAKRSLPHWSASFLIAAVLGMTLCARGLAFPEKTHLDGDLALLAVIALPLTLLSIPATSVWQRQAVLMTLGGMLLKILYDTENRGAAVALLAVGIAAWCLSRRRWMTLGLAAPFLIAGGLWFTQTDYWNRFEDYVVGRETSNQKTADSRLRIWRSALQIAADHPVFGVGWGNSHQWTGNYGAGEAGITTHNNFLGVLTETGFPGLLLYAGLFGSIGLGLFQRIRVADDFASREGRALLCGFVAYFVGGMFLTRHDLVLAYILAGWGVGCRSMPLALPLASFAWLNVRLPAFTASYREAAAPFLSARRQRGRTMPRSWHFATLALLATGLAIYGSLVPLEWKTVSFADAIERFRNIRYLELGVQSRSDLVANVLLFVPLGFLWAGSILVDLPKNKGAIVKGIGLVGLLVGLACAIEFTQIWFPRRTVSLNDILAESTGAILGTVAWFLFGPQLTEWCRRLLGVRDTENRANLALQAYALAFSIYSLLPFDVTIRLAEIHEKHKLGRIVLVPFSAPHSSVLQNLYDLALDIVFLIPIGILACSVGMRKGNLRSIPTSFALALLFVCGLETAQVFIYSRYSDTTDLITGTLGVVIGIGLVHWWSGPSSAVASRRSLVIQRNVWVWLGLASAYVLLLATLFWAPFDFSLEPAVLKPRVKEFIRVPFQVLYTGSDFNAMLQILRKGLWFAPLGVLLACGILATATSKATARMLIAGAVVLCGLVAGGIELGQLLLPSKIFDLTDVLLCWLGGVIGLASAWLLLPRRTTKSQQSSTLRETRNRSNRTVPLRQQPDVIIVPPSRPEDVTKLAKKPPSKPST